MEPAKLVAVMIPALIAIAMPIVLSAPYWKQEEEKARQRRMAEHRMNARLLRFDI